LRRTARRSSQAGFAGWSVLGVAAVVVFLSGPAQTYGVSVFIDPLIEETGWSRSLVSTAYSLATLVSAAGLLIVGRQIDRIGNKRVLIAAAIVFGFSLWIASVVTTPLMLFVAFALLRTFGSGTLTLSGRTLIPHWFVRRRGRAFSIVGIAAALSLALIPPFGEALISAFGWRIAWRIEAVAIWLILIPLIVLFVHNRPESLGQYPDGDRPMRSETGEVTIIEEPSWSLRQAARLRPFWLLLGAGVVPSLVVTGLSFNQVSIFTSRGLPSSLAATTFTIESIVALPTTLMSGWISDRFAPRYVLAASQACLALAMVCLLAGDSVGLALVYAGLRGASMGLWNTAADVTWPTYFGKSNLGSIRSVTFAAGVVGAAIGPLPLGFVFDATGSYNLAIAGMLALPILGAAAVFFARPPGAPPAATAKVSATG
jgi:MFS family permease